MLIPRNSPLRKSLTRSAMCVISSSSPLLAHVEPPHQMRRDADLGELQHQELADAVVEDALSGDDAALLAVERDCLVREMLDKGAGFGAPEQHLRLALMNAPTLRHNVLLQSLG